MGTLLVSIFIMSLITSMALPVWHHVAQREREAELIFRGQQYARAIALWQRQRPGSTPEDLDTLVEQRFLRKRYRDPMTNHGDFRILLQSDLVSIESGRISDDRGQAEPTTVQDSSDLSAFEEGGGLAGGIVGVVSTSTASSIRSYNGRNRYDEWFFIHTVPEEVDTPVGQANSGDGSTASEAIRASPAPR